MVTFYDFFFITLSCATRTHWKYFPMVHRPSSSPGKLDKLTPSPLGNLIPSVGVVMNIFLNCTLLINLRNLKIFEENENLFKRTISFGKLIDTSFVQTNVVFQIMAIILISVFKVSFFTLQLATMTVT